MVVNLREFYIPALIISVIIGYQISIYFLYQYNKYKNENIDLNAILLAYGILFGLTLSGFLIRVINLYWIKAFNLQFFNFLTRLTFIILYSALMVFFIIISRKPFQEFINLKLTKLTYIIIIISLFSVLLLEIETILFSIISGLTLLYCYSFISYFQRKIIKLSTGNIKKRLNFIFIGMILCVLQHFIGGYIPSYVLFTEYSDMLQLISVPIFIIGLLMIFLGIYKFPAFLEFRWKDHLFSFLIINRKKFKIIYNFNFKRNKYKDEIGEENLIKSRRKALFLSTGIFAIDDIVSIITNSSSNQIQKIKQGSLILFMINGEDSLNFLMYCLLVDKDMISFNYFLRQVRDNFERMYKNILKNIDILKGNENKLFSNFDKAILKLIE